MRKFVVRREPAMWPRRTTEHRVSTKGVHEMDMNVSRTNQPGTSTKSPGLPESGKSGLPAQGAVKRTAPEPCRIAQRAYELYLQRDRQDGRALEDWLQAEQQLLEAVSHK
jgi:hypothetical protein